MICEVYKVACWNRSYNTKSCQQWQFHLERFFNLIIDLLLHTMDFANTFLMNAGLEKLLRQFKTFQAI